MKEKWKKARLENGNIPLVMDLVKEGLGDLRRGRKNMSYPFNLDGRQRRCSERGETKIEAKLLSTSEFQKKCLLISNNCSQRKEVEFKANAAGIGNRRKDNIIADLFGLDKNGCPVAGEVKISDRNPWYAVVECVAQVVLLRSDRKNLMGWIKGRLGESVRGRGAWGMVIAPEKYWDKIEAKKAELLVDILRRETKIRICCVSYNKSTMFDSSQIQLKVVFGNPPSTK